MARSIASMLAYEAKKRPALQEMLDRIPYVTQEEIEQAPFLKWIRQALAQMVKQQTSEGIMRGLTEANLCNIVDGFMPDPMGELRRWTGSPTYLTTSSNGMSILIEPGDLLWLPEKGGMWLHGVYTKLRNPSVWSLSVHVSKTTRSGYKDACQEQLSRLTPSCTIDVGTPSATASSGPMGALAAYGVRISRP